MKKFFSSLGYVLLLILAYVAFQGVFTFVTMLVAMVYAYSKGYLSLDSLDKMADFEILVSSPETNGIYVWGMAMGLFLSTITMLLFMHLVKCYRMKSDMFSSMSSKSLLLSTLLVFSSMLALNIFVQWFRLEDILAAQFDGLAHNVVGVITMSLLAPLLEEVFFRGAIQGYLLKRYKPWVAILSASLVFGIFHMNPVQVVYATLLGIVLGWIYYRTGSLLSVIVGHVLNNSIASVTLLLFGNEELQVLPDNASPMAETASEVFVFLLFAVLSVYFAVRLHRSLPPVPSPWQDYGGTAR